MQRICFRVNHISYKSWLHCAWKIHSPLFRTVWPQPDEVFYKPGLLLRMSLTGLACPLTKQTISVLSSWKTLVFLLFILVLLLYHVLANVLLREDCKSSSSCWLNKKWMINKSVVNLSTSPSQNHTLQKPHTWKTMFIYIIFPSYTFCSMKWEWEKHNSSS